MDTFELERRERWAELAASIAQADRNNEAKARRHSWFRFVFNWRQIVDAPDVPVPSPGAHALPHTSAAPGLGSGVAGFRDVTSTNALTPLASGSRLPGGPHHF